MASSGVRKSAFVMLIVYMAAMSAVEAALTCDDVVSHFLPCVSYLQSGGQPAAQCCNGVKHSSVRLKPRLTVKKCAGALNRPLKKSRSRGSTSLTRPASPTNVMSMFLTRSAPPLTATKYHEADFDHGG
ncbi:Detected protein of confused Function [Hibiscus syriacus]|uniref:Detected protein of confused Function n=1 Tax=Hibiscus syriacus TaxID=106335 RepID=A0A6A2WH38_HIBSY|nr:Detected protein of confused Function [Hibiscus syriacus]